MGVPMVPSVGRKIVIAFDGHEKSWRCWLAVIILASNLGFDIASTPDFGFGHRPTRLRKEIQKRYSSLLWQQEAIRNNKKSIMGLL